MVEVYTFTSLAGESIYINDINMTIEQVKKYIAMLKYWFLISIIDNGTFEIFLKFQMRILIFCLQNIKNVLLSLMIQY